MNNTTVLSHIMDFHPNLIVFALDDNYNYISFNQLHSNIMKNIWGVDIELNNSIIDYIQIDSDKEKARKNFDRALAGESFTTVEQYGEKNLERAFFKDTYYPLKDENNQIYGLGVMVEDVTLSHSNKEELSLIIRQLEEQVDKRTLELEKINSDLQEENAKRIESQKELIIVKSQIEKALANEMELNKLKTKFIAMVSHEFRTPLTIIQSATFLLEKSYERSDEEKFFKNLDKISKSIDTMTALMENVLNIGKLEHGEIKASKKVFDIRSEVKNLVESNKAYSKVVKMRLPEETVFVESDKVLCTQIVNNLLSNAIKYSGEKPKIKLSLVADGYNCTITVRDKGIGIAKENINNLTEAFKREDKISSLVQGTGLGLSIIKHNLDLLGGTMNIDSELDVGTKVTITIPR
ncbi:MAG: HAMP domain-containing sensor histidine kinase [Candidatus Kapaibacterium sp.]